VCEISMVLFVSRLQNICHFKFVELWFVVTKLLQE